jgi:hypothetical protein
MKSSNSRSPLHHWRYLVAATAVVLAFAVAYGVAGYLAPTRTWIASAAATAATTVRTGGGACAMGGGGGCRGGVASTPVTGTATTQGGVQRLRVAVGAAGYTPNVLQLEAGVPAEITFSRSAGCTARVLSEDLGFDVDLTNGPQVVRLPALNDGTYAFSCGMRMVFGSIVVATGEAGS